MQSPTVECPSCKRAVDVRAFLSACSSFWSNVNVVRFTCPLCGERADARLESYGVSLGYVYAAGGPHFCGMLDTRINELLVYRDGADLVAELDGATWRIRAIDPAGSGSR